MGNTAQCYIFVLKRKRFYIILKNNQMLFKRTVFYIIFTFLLHKNIF